MWVECKKSLILNSLLHIGQKVESSGLHLKKLDKQRKQKSCWQDLMISGFLSRFSHMLQTQRWKWGFISGAKSFKVNFSGSKSGSVISFKFSKADYVQILVLALVLPRDIFLVFSFCVTIILFWSKFTLLQIWQLVLCGFHSLNGVSFIVVFRFVELVINK